MVIPIRDHLYGHCPHWSRAPAACPQPAGGPTSRPVLARTRRPAEARTGLPPRSATRAPASGGPLGGTRRAGPGGRVAGAARSEAVCVGGWWVDAGSRVLGALRPDAGGLRLWTRRLGSWILALRFWWLPARAGSWFRVPGAGGFGSWALGFGPFDAGFALVLGVFGDGRRRRVWGWRSETFQGWREGVSDFSNVGGGFMGLTGFAD